jgi:hypothetical protein
MPPRILPRPPSLLFVAALAAGLSAAAAYAAVLAAGPGLGAIFGGMVFCAILLPPAALAEVGSVRGAAAAVGVVGGVGAVWLLAMNVPEMPLSQRMTLVAVLACFGLAVFGAACLLARVGLAPIWAAAIAVVLGLTWLSWPIWLTALLPAGDASAGDLASALARFHPPLVANSVLTLSEPWTEESIAYRWLTNLNQDVPVALPESPWPCLILHAAFGALCWLAGMPKRDWLALVRPEKPKAADK